MNELKVFNYESNEVRTIMRDGEPWFVLKDVCMVLGIANHKNVAARLEDDEKDGVRMADPIGRMQDTTIINESGLYNVWDTNAVDRGEDVPLKENDHCMDAVRYMVKTLRLVKKSAEKEHRSIWD